MGLVLCSEAHLHSLKEIRVYLICVLLLFFKHFEEKVLLLSAVVKLLDLFYLAENSEVGGFLLFFEVIEDFSLLLGEFLLIVSTQLFLLSEKLIIDVDVECIPQEKGVFTCARPCRLKHLLMAGYNRLQLLHHAFPRGFFKATRERCVLQLFLLFNFLDLRFERFFHIV